MILSDIDAQARLNSPINLINRLKTSSNGRSKAMSLFGIGLRPEEVKKIDEPAKQSFNPFLRETPQETISNEKESPLAATALAIQSDVKTDDIIKDSDRQIKLTIAHDKALDTLTAAVDRMNNTLHEVRPDKLPAIVAATSKVVESIRRERNEAAKGSKDREVHYHFYTPTQRKVIDFDVIEVSPSA